MLTTFNPRDYQINARNATINNLVNSTNSNPVVALPGGTGKSVVIADTIRSINWYWPHKRHIMATHSQDLVGQNYNKIISMLPDLDIGVYSAGLKRKEYGHKVVFGNIQSMARKPELFSHIDVMYVDECHRIGPNDRAQYNQFIGALKEVNPHLRVVGYSATPYRQGMGSLVDGDLFTEICYDMTGIEQFNWFIEQGYLSRLTAYPTATKLDVSQVATQAGDFNQKQLAEAVDKDEITYAGLQEMVRSAEDRSRWLVFGVGIKHLTTITGMLQQLGVSADMVHSKRKDSREVMARHQAGEFTAMVTDSMVTTGYDDPMVDCIGLFRPVRSVSLHVQILSRGTRPVYAQGYELATKEGRLAAIQAGPKSDGCLVLDFGQNIERLGPINDPKIPKRKGAATGELPIKICAPDKLKKNTGAWPDGCMMYNHPTARICDGCGGEFIFKVHITDKADKKDVIAGTAGKNEPKEQVIQAFHVDHVAYERHVKKGMPTSMRVTYTCGIRTFNEYVCLDHDGPPHHIAKAWWKGRNNGLVPQTVEQGFSMVDDLLVPKKIRVDVTNKYQNVINGEF